MNLNILYSIGISALLLQAANARQGGAVDNAASPDTLTDTSLTSAPSPLPESGAVAAEKTAAKHSGRPAAPVKNDEIVVRETLDTVFIFDKRVFRHVAQDWRHNIDIFRQRGYGGSGGMSFGANAIFIGPVKDLVENDPKFNFDTYQLSRFGFEPLLMSGGLGYIGFGDGFRLGGGGMSGELLSDCNTTDTMSLSTKVGYGGLLIEKVFVRGRWNIQAGGMLGGGGITVSLTENNLLSFDNLDEDSPADGRKAVFFLVDPHVGFTYTFLYFFHVGASLTVPAFMSIDKFSPFTDDFFTVNPGIHIKLIFGNLG